MCAIHATHAFQTRAWCCMNLASTPQDTANSIQALNRNIPTQRALDSHLSM
jgi:hypothetical protein